MDMTMLLANDSFVQCKYLLKSALLLTPGFAIPFVAILITHPYLLYISSHFAFCFLFWSFCLVLILSVVVAIMSPSIIVK